MTYVRMADAAYAANIPPGYEIAAGYYGGPNAYHVWPASDWDRFPGDRLPIWVGGTDGAGEGQQAVAALVALGIPKGGGFITALDMEARKDDTYVSKFGSVLLMNGYRVWIYGSASMVFGNPPLNGYWVADYTSDMAVIDGLLAHEHVRAVQYAAVGPFDASLVKQWTEGGMWHG